MANSQSNEFRDQRRKRDETDILRKLDEYAKRNSQLEPLEPPRNVLKFDLSQFEKESLGWLVRRDNSDELPPFWEEKDGLFIRDFDKNKTDLRPKPFRGGIYAAAGVRKVVTLISMTACDKHETGYSLRSRLGEHTRKTTLIVCCDDSFPDWVNNLNETIRPGTLSVYRYKEPKENPTADTLWQNDIVLTSYNELLSPACTLRKMGWRRVILDDVDHVRELNREKMKSVLNLKAEKRWIVIRDGICMDLFLKFLKFEPFTSDMFWRRWVENPMASEEPEGMARHQAVLKTISLIRDEEFPPPLILENYFVELSPKEREIHDTLETAALALQRLLAPHTSICSDPNLLPKYMKKKLPSNNIQDVGKKPELQDKLGNKEAECVVCISDIPNLERVITKCKHVFCRFCILKCLRGNQHCPICRSDLTTSDLYAAHPEERESASSKAEALLQLLERDKIGNKSVVFSKIDKALQNLQATLDKTKYKTLILLWPVKDLQLNTVLRQFNEVNHVPIVLLVLQKPRIRLNLTAATRVYFLEPWELEEEKEAVGCVWGLGQKSEVNAVRLIARDTIEDPTPIPEEY